MTITKGAVLQAAAVLTAAKLETGAALAAAQGAETAKTAAKARLNLQKSLEDSIQDILAAMEYIDKNKGQSAFKLWTSLP